MKKEDIKSKKDIELLINSFYKKIFLNLDIGFIFTDIAKIDFESHLPIMYSFWNTLLLGEQSYMGNPMKKHIALGKLTQMTENEFSIWLALFEQTVHENFKGEKANEAIQRANNIAKLMLFNINK